MKKMKSNSTRKFAFTLNTSKPVKNPIQDILKNSNFYYDLENQCNSIRKKKKNLISLKNKLIPELVYTNKDIPIVWKKKSNFKDSIVNIMANNEKFLSYIGKEGVQTEPNITPKENINNSNCTPFISYINKTSRNNTLKENNSTLSFKKSNYWNNKNKYNEIKIKIILDDYKINYPLYDCDNIKRRKKSLTERTINKTINFDINKLPLIMRLRRKDTFIKSIYNNIMLPNDKIDSKDSKNIIKQNNSYNNKMDKEFEVEDSEIQRKLETINYYGPYYSYCRPCKKRNIDFYNNYEKSSCLKLLQYLKTARGKKLIDEKLNSKI